MAGVVFRSGRVEKWPPASKPGHYSECIGAFSRGPCGGETHGGLAKKGRDFSAKMPRRRKCNMIPLGAAIELAEGSPAEVDNIYRGWGSQRHPTTSPNSPALSTPGDVVKIPFPPPPACTKSNFLRSRYKCK